MKKKLIGILLAAFLCVSALGLCIACNGGDDNPSNPSNPAEPVLKDITGVTFTDKTVTYSGSEQTITVTGTIPSGVNVSYKNNKGTNVGTYNATATLSGTGYNALTLNAILTIEAPIPSKAEVVAARKRAVEDNLQQYDFSLMFTGDFSALGLGTSLDGGYDGAYRYNKATDNLSFARTASGALLPDSTAYLFTSGDSQIKMTVKDSKVKKVSVATPEDQNITMVNLPVVALVDSIKEANIEKVTKSTSSSYTYSCPVSLDKSNPESSIPIETF